MAADSTNQQAESSASGQEVLRLHIGGREAKQGWKILNIQDGPGVDFVGNCVDLSQFPDGSVAEIYASHVVEHLGYQQELPKALAEFHRVLRPGGRALISVPDLELLCRMFLHPELKPEQRFYLMRVIMGGQCDDH
ncbi:MAG: methyltransferase domain-containing protein, partial [Phycisphaerae bacterium]|nr:methyltransferase domain-containing protein [Phycisphaerae bacterium]